MPFTDQPLVVGDTADFTIHVKKDGAVWDISGATVTLTLRDPDGNTVGPFSATVSNGPGGIAHYQVADTVLDQSGDWARQWKVEKSGVELKTRIINFTVEPSL